MCEELIVCSFLIWITHIVPCLQYQESAHIVRFWIEWEYSCCLHCRDIDALRTCSWGKPNNLWDGANQENNTRCIDFSIDREDEPRNVVLLDISEELVDCSIGSENDWEQRILEDKRRGKRTKIVSERKWRFMDIMEFRRETELWILGLVGFIAQN